MVVPVVKDTFAAAEKPGQTQIVTAIKAIFG